MAGLLIRRQAEGTWILACLQHVVACWDSRPDDWMGQKETFLFASDCFIIFPGLLNLIYSVNLPDGMLPKSVGFILQICLAKTTPEKNIWKKETWEWQ